MMMSTLIRLALLLTTLSTGAATLWGQSLAKLYVSRAQPVGTLYFIRPDQMTTLSGDARLKTYDYTHIDTTDSVTMLLTLLADTPLETPELHLSGADTTTRHDIQYIYRRAQGRRWESRLRIAMGYDRWQQLYASELPLRLALRLPSGDEGVYSYSSKKWRRLREVYGQFFKLVELNRPTPQP